MKKAVLFIINLIAGLAFCIAAGCLGSDYSNVIACSVTMLISFAWMLLFIYANSR